MYEKGAEIRLNDMENHSLLIFRQHPYHAPIQKRRPLWGDALNKGMHFRLGLSRMGFFDQGLLFGGGKFAEMDERRLILRQRHAKAKGKISFRIHSHHLLAKFALNSAFHTRKASIYPKQAPMGNEIGLLRKCFFLNIRPNFTALAIDRVARHSKKRYNRQEHHTAHAGS